MRHKLATLLSVAGLICTLTLVAGPVLAANSSANLDQCANDPAPSPSSNGCNSNANQWVNGNLNASKTVYSEGDSIPYRLRFDNLSTSGSHTVKIEWDTTKGGKHALDYIDDFNESVLNADPCLGVASCNPGTYNTFAIPPDPQVTGAGVTPNAGDFRIYGGAITAVSTYFYSTGTGFAGDKSAGLTLTFTASRVNPVIAWGGHIATRLNWGPGGSAVAISGSPYHTRVLELDGSGGNQDRSLSADAVIFPGSITIVKHASVNGSTQFNFTASAAAGSVSPTSFGLIDNGTDPTQALDDATAGGGITSFTTYTVTESDPGSNWALDSISCVVATGTGNGGSQTPNLGTRSVAINLKEGEQVTCTFNNNFVAAPALTIDKSFVSVTGGTANAAGDVISYSVLVSNTGNVTLTGVSVTDPLVSNLDCNPSLTGQQNTGLTIAVNGSITCTGTYVLQQSDLDNNGGGDGDIDNTATADSDQTTPLSDSVAVPLVVSPGIEVIKVDDGETFSAVDEVITYTITVNNTGNTTLTGVSVTDANAAGLDCDPATAGNQTTGFTINVGGHITCTASHTVTQADLDAGTYFNRACATATGGTSDCGDVTTPGDQNPALDVVKVDDLNGGKYENLGDVIHYTITVTNTGNVTLNNVSVTDPKAAGLDCDPLTGGNQTTGFTIAVGAHITCTASHTIVQADLDAGHYLNTACADDGPNGAVEDCGSVDSPGKNQPTIVTADKFIPQDSITLAGIGGSRIGGTLYVELRINEACGAATTPPYSKSWADADNGTFNTDNTVAVSTDATIRWCTSYSGNADNAARPLSSRSEIASIDFDPVGITSFGAGALAMLAYTLWSRRRRERED